MKSKLLYSKLKKRRGETVKGRDSAPVPSASASSRHKVPIITLLTDFGTADYFVAAMKGVILSENPSARIIDLTHDIPPHDIEAGALTLLAAHSSFPAGTIHVAVVDPGVGSPRRPILVVAGEQTFIGPDNGLLSFICEHFPDSETFHLTNSKYFREPVSPTFNGRDVFAPVAAAFSMGVKAGELGTRITDYLRLNTLRTERTSKGRIKGRIIHVDRFGNCVTNITRDELSLEQIAAGATLRVKGKTIRSFRNYFAEEKGSRDKVFGVWGSAGFLEIAAANKSAAKLLKAKRGDSAIVDSYRKATL